MMKKWKRCIVALVLVLAVAGSAVRAGVTVYAEEREHVTEDGFHYSVNESDNAVTITSYSGNGGNVVIPSTIDGMSVTRIEEAFRYCYSLTNITIPGNVTFIDNYAFAECNNLTKIDVELSNKNYACQDGVMFNKEMTEVICYPAGKSGAYVIPDSVTSIGRSAFFSCHSLTSVTIPNSVTGIEYGAFADCTSLRTVTIPNSVTSIGAEAFRDCLSLGAIIIPCSVTSIGEGVFGIFYYPNHGLIDLYYEGTQTDWEKVNGASLDYSYDVTVHYNSTFPNQITLDVSNIQLPVSNIKIITATIIPSNATVKKVKWISSDMNVVSCSDNGKIVAKALGTATITAETVNGLTASCTVTVINSPKESPKAVVNVKAVSASYDSNKITWKKDSAVMGYEIYRSVNKNGTYKRIGTVTKNSTISYTDKKLTTGKTYYYKIRAYKTVGNTNYYGNYSKVVSAKPILAKTTITSVKNAGSQKLTVKWNKVKGANGYEIYRAASKKGKYRNVKTITNANTVSFKDKKLTKGKIYYYKIKSYRTVNKKKVYSTFSDVKSCKISKK